MAVKIVDKELALKLKELGFDMEVYDSFREFYLRQDFRKYKKMVEKQVNQ